jgi:hypothetical protein
LIPRGGNEYFSYFQKRDGPRPGRVVIQSIRPDLTCPSVLQHSQIDDTRERSSSGQLRRLRYYGPSQAATSERPFRGSGRSRSEDYNTTLPEIF